MELDTLTNKSKSYAEKYQKSLGFFQNTHIIV